MKKVIDYFDVTQDCLFSAFLAPVWVYAFPDASELDSYFLLKYGGRTAFEITLDKFANANGIIEGAELKKLADMIYHMNARKWENLFKVYNAEYSPIENTDVYEEVKEDNSMNRVIDSDKSSRDSNETHTGVTASGSNDGTANKFGFNSSEAVGERTTGNTSSASTSTTTQTANETIDADDTTITDAENKQLIRRKHGNIGVQDNTVMMQKSIDFWKWTFIDSICKDICDFIALSIY